MERFDFESVFDMEFGAKAKKSEFPTRESSDYLIGFRTPNHSEENVGFFFNVALQGMMGNTLLTVLDAEDDMKAMFSHKRALSMFVNRDGVDPKAGKPSGHPWIPTKVRDTWLLPDHEYVLHVYRTRHDDRQPLGISYYGDDKNQVDYGPGEVPVEGIPMVFGSLKGVFYEED
jgi:hypothetical protein